MFRRGSRQRARHSRSRSRSRSPESGRVENDRSRSRSKSKGKGQGQVQGQGQGRGKGRGRGGNRGKRGGGNARGRGRQGGGGRGHWHGHGGGGGRGGRGRGGHRYNYNLKNNNNHNNKRNRNKRNDGNNNKNRNNKANYGKNDKFDFNSNSDDDIIGYLCYQFRKNSDNFSILKCLRIFERCDLPFDLLMEAIEIACDESLSDSDMDNDSHSDSDSMRNSGGHSSDANDLSENKDDVQGIATLADDTEQLFVDCWEIVNCLNPSFESYNGYNLRQNCLIRLMHCCLQNDENDSDIDAHSDKNDKKDENDETNDNIIESDEKEHGLKLLQMYKQFEEKQNDSQKLQQLAINMDNKNKNENIDKLLLFVEKQEENISPGSSYQQLISQMDDALSAYKKESKHLENEMVKKKEKNEEKERKLIEIDEQIENAEKIVIQAFEDCEKLLQEKESLLRDISNYNAKNKQGNKSKDEKRLQRYKETMLELNDKLTQLRSYQHSNHYHINQLKQKYEKQSKTNWKNWDASQIVLFLKNELKHNDNVVIDFHLLKNNMIQDNFDGSHLNTIDKSDLRSFGIQDYTTRNIVLAVLRDLCKNNNNHDDNNAISSMYSPEGQETNQ